MKIHYKEWTTVVFRFRRGRISQQRVLFGNLFDPDQPRTWPILEANNKTQIAAFTSGNRYFLFSGTPIEVDAYFEDVVHPIIKSEGRSRANENVIYPIYQREIVLTEKTYFVLCFPYSALAREVLEGVLELSFCRVRIKELLSLMHSKTLEPDLDIRDLGSRERTTPEVILRSGRFPMLAEARASEKAAASERFHDETHLLRSVVLDGDNVMRSSLYRRLLDGSADGRKYEFSGAVARISYWSPSETLVATKVDRRGNFSFRPGAGGSNLQGFESFLLYCERHGLLEETDMLPVRNPIEFV